MVSFLGYSYVLKDYETSTNILLNSIHELEKSTIKMKDYSNKLEILNHDFEILKNNSIYKKELDNLRSEFLKIFVNLFLYLFYFMSRIILMLNCWI